MKLTYLLVALLAVVVIAGGIYIKRDSFQPTVPSPSPSFTSDLYSTSASSPTPLSIINSIPMPSPFNETVHATMKTNMGSIELELDGQAAPITVGNFVELSKTGFYNNTSFHRVIPQFMIQGGDPLSKDQTKRAIHGTGDPGYKFQDEINSLKVVRGVIAMANSGPNTNGSQFFIVTGAAFPHLDGNHTVFGKVTKGMDIVDAISNVEADSNDNPLKPVIVESITIK